MSSHHLVLGEIQDFITGETLPKTHDEILRQSVSRLLVEQKGFDKNDIIPRQDLLLTSGSEQAIVKIDYLIRLYQKTYMLIKYGPGDLVSRQRPALGMSRLVESYQVPVVVVTNGKDADILLGSSSKVIRRGLYSIPSRSDLIRQYDAQEFTPITKDRAEMESRIVLAYEILGSCPCDTTSVRRL